ncbi:MAG: AmmeMemoRadiSam system protein A [Gammaproteobacteria bacterium]|nr:AmmeMemoRadiSam system protein A [Gammaproteobacteria bacterium]
MPSADSSNPSLNGEDRDRLLQLARDSIQHGLTRGSAMRVDDNSYPARLREKLACFVTLNRNGALRGCIGHLEAEQPLVKDVAENAFAAAFRDPRFPPVSEREVAGLEIHISILSPSHPMEFGSEQDLIQQLRPGQDGLILECRGHRGTFLPSVWESLPDAQSFLMNLKLKAGLATDFWSEDVRISRYTTDSFTD